MSSLDEILVELVETYPGLSLNTAGEIVSDLTQFGGSADAAKAARVALYDEANKELARRKALAVATGAGPDTATAPPPPDAIASLLAKLNEINGQDAYSVQAEALGKLKADEYLVVPEGLGPTAPNDVGRGGEILTNDLFSQVYAANYFEHIPERYRLRFALLRAMAVSIGWFNNQSETVRRKMPPGYARQFLADAAQIEDELANAKKFAFLIPFLAEHIFRTTGHHYLDSQAREYEDKYNRLANACLAPLLSSYLPASILYHEALHWVGPERVRAVLNARGNDGGIPDAILVRENAAPAGTAIITTTAAVLEAMTGSGVKAQFAEHGGFNLQEIEDMAGMIKASPTRYHKAHFAYAVRGLTKEEKDDLDRASKEAIRFAPYAKGFVMAMFGDAALGRARVLDKYADNDPIAKRRTNALFRKIAKTAVNEVADLFVGRPGEEE